MALEASQKLSVIGAAETPQGVRLEMALSDESGLRWRLTGWRLLKNSEAVYVLYRAPEKHFFGRHQQAAQMMAAAIEVNR
jgi:hypothetical protein